MLKLTVSIKIIFSGFGWELGMGFSGLTNYNLTKEYFQKLKAPKKEFFTFEKSAHFPPFEEPEKFNDLIKSNFTC